MTRFRSKLVYFAALLAVALTLGVTHRASACPSGASGPAPMSCCDGMAWVMQQPAVQHAVGAHMDCATTLGRFSGCASTGHCSSGQAVRAAQVTAREGRPAVFARLPILVWSGPPVMAGRILPSQGPPDTRVPEPPGRHTYLATLRLRI